MPRPAPARAGLLTLSLALTLAACGSDGTAAGLADAASDVAADTSAAIEDTSATLADVADTASAVDTVATSSGEPDYDAVFPQGEVPRVEIVIRPEDWAAMQADLEALLGASSTGPGPPPGGVELDEDPIYVEATVRFRDVTLEHVGVRYKGNSSLRSAYQQGNGKLPLRLKFDEFEDTYPEIDDQRLFGFKHVSLANGFKDDSLIRSKLARDLYVAAGVPTAQNAFWRVFVDHGDGLAYFGLYTAGEVPQDKSFLDTWFDDHDGNLYKPEGIGAQWASWDEASLEKKTQEDAADFSDALALFDALHADRGDAAAWRAGLEEVLDVDLFLRWLAVNTAIQNWDTYGVMSHNYYLYEAEATDGRFVWIPWDHNEALQANDRAPALDLAEVTAQWPLIRYLMDDPIYSARYREVLAELVDTVLDPDTLAPIVQATHDLVSPYVLGDEGEVAGYTFVTHAAIFTNSADVIVSHLRNRASAIAAYLAE